MSFTTKQQIADVLSIIKAGNISGRWQNIFDVEQATGLQPNVVLDAARTLEQQNHIVLSLTASTTGKSASRVRLR